MGGFFVVHLIGTHLYSSTIFSILVMNMKKNIILFTGRDTYGIEQDVQRWIRTFTEKYSDMNIEHIYLDTLKNNESIYRQNILSSGLFADKRLFIIS